MLPIFWCFVEYACCCCSSSWQDTRGEGEGQVHATTLWSTCWTQASSSFSQFSLTSLPSSVTAQICSQLSTLHCSMFIKQFHLSGNRWLAVANLLQVPRSRLPSLEMSCDGNRFLFLLAAVSPQNIIVFSGSHYRTMYVLITLEGSRSVWTEKTGRMSLSWSNSPHTGTQLFLAS